PALAVDPVRLGRPRRDQSAGDRDRARHAAELHRQQALVLSLAGQKLRFCPDFEVRPLVAGKRTRAKPARSFEMHCADSQRTPREVTGTSKVALASWEKQFISDEREAMTFKSVVPPTDAEA